MTVAKEIRTMSLTAGGANGKNIAIDCSEELDTGELMTGSLTVPAVTNLTISSPAINTATIEINKRDIVAGKAMIFNVKCTVAGTYTIKPYANTDATPSQTIDAELTLIVK